MDGRRDPEKLIAPRLRARPRLLALVVGLPVVEALILMAIAPASSVPLSVHVTAPEPFGIFHDLRWLLVYHPGWLAFAGEALLFLALRTALTAAVVRQVWPVERDVPSWPALLRRSAAFTVLVGLLFSPWAALAFGAAVMSLSWLFFVAIPLTLFMAVLLHHAVVTVGWWGRGPTARTMGWILSAFVGLTVFGGLMAELDGVFRLVAVAAGGLFNAWAWHGIVRGSVDRPVITRFVPLAPLGVASLVAVAAVGTTIGFELARPHRSVEDAQLITAGGRPVLVVSGFGSGWSGGLQQRFGPGFDERRFSYRGVNERGDPLPYKAEETLRSLPHLTRLMARQVEELHHHTGEPVSIVAESEGALVAKAYLTAHPDAPVNRLVMLSPLVRPARVYYPPDGEDGWGVAAAWELQGLSALIRGLTPLTVDTDTALFRSVADHGGALRGVLACPLPDVRELIIAPVADAVASSEFDVGGIRAISVPDFHGGLLGDAASQDLVAEELRGGSPDGSEAWSAGARALRALAAGWQVPELEASLNPAWEDQDEAGCDTVRRHLRGWAS